MRKQKGRGNNSTGVARGVVANPFIVKEEKELIFFNRSSEVGTELVEAVRRLLSSTLVFEETVGVECPAVPVIIPFPWKAFVPDFLT